MAWDKRLAILVDGEYAKKKLERQLRRFPSAQGVINECTRISSTPPLDRLELFRIYYYTAEPLDSTTTHPLGGPTMDFAQSATHLSMNSVIDAKIPCSGRGS
jgi:hypothetical protein